MTMAPGGQLDTGYIPSTKAEVLALVIDIDRAIRLLEGHTRVAGTSVAAAAGKLIWYLQEWRSTEVSVWNQQHPGDRIA